MKKQLLILALLLPFGTLFSQTANTFLWRVTNPANDSASYLFGTIHLPQEKFMRLPDSVYKAVSATTVFYNEINLAGIQDEMEEIQAFSKEKLHYLDSVKTTPAWRRLIAGINQHYHQSIDPDSLDQFNRFGAALLQESFKPEPGVLALDMALMGYALTLGKQTKGLERYVFQLRMLYDILDARLADTTLLFGADEKLTKGLAEFYGSKHLDSIGQLIQSINPSYRNVVFDNRNKTMADSIARVIKNSTAFFAIGAGHLTGSTGLLPLLKAKGFRVEPVFSDNVISITLMKEIFQTGIANVRQQFSEKKDKKSQPPPYEEVKIYKGTKATTKPTRKTK